MKKIPYHWSEVRMNQDETVICHNERVSIDAKLFLKIKSEN